MRVFEYQSYKVFLKDYAESAGRKGVITELAKAAGCTHSYLSQVLNGKPDLTPDQALALAEYLLLSKDEIEYFFTLVLFGRASSSKLRQHLEVKLKSIKSEYLGVTKIVSKTSDTQLQASLRNRYYSQWHMGAIHTLTASSAYQTVGGLAERLNLSQLDVDQHLQWLLENNLVKKSGDRFSHSGQNIHLPTDSIHNQINHLNWRLRGLQTSSKTM